MSVTIVILKVARFRHCNATCGAHNCTWRGIDVSNNFNVVNLISARIAMVQFCGGTFWNNS